MHLLIQGPFVKTPAWAQGAAAGKAGTSRYLAFHLGAVVGVRLRGHREAVSVNPQIAGVEGKVHLGWWEGSLTLCGTSEQPPPWPAGCKLRVPLPWPPAPNWSGGLGVSVCWQMGNNQLSLKKDNL